MATEKKTTTSKNPKVEEAREHFKTAHESMRESYAAMVPPEVREERKKARKEMLLGLRGLLDAAIEHIDSQTKK